MTHLLVVEDDPSIAMPLMTYLLSRGFRAVHAPSLAEATRQIAENAFDAIILDWALPDGDGVAWLRTRKGSTPVIMLTARADLIDKVLGLEGGANDYLTKPFEPRELEARIHAQIRSSRAAPDEDTATLSSSGIVLNPVTLDVTFNGDPVTLTQMEFKLLHHFLRHPRRALSRTDILNAVWGLRYPTTRTVDVHVGQLRQKFSQELFETLHGVGYRFVAKPCT